jgi:glyoxylase-like metal-dependent hydrolase (beta-lactamase superfamily II)
MAAAEDKAMRQLWQEGDAYKAALGDFFAGWGATPDQQQGIIAFMQGFRMGCPLPETAVRHLCPGEILHAGGRCWKLYGGYGHTSCNLLLHDAHSGWVLTGDQVLPTIQPNVSLWFGAAPDPVDDFLRSLDHLASLEVTSACPSHGEVFAHFSLRCEQQIKQQHKRLDRLRRALRDGITDAGSLCQAVLGKPADGPLFMLVAGQLYALLAHLEQRGEVQRRNEATGVLFQLID